MKTLVCRKCNKSFMVESLDFGLFVHFLEVTKKIDLCGDCLLEAIEYLTPVHATPTNTNK